MRALICGGRSYDKWSKIHETLTALSPAVLIQGGANGCDAMVRRWADVNNVPCVTYEANWKAGKKAGPQRNSFMLADSRPDVCVVFPGGRGTQDMATKAEAAGVRMLWVRP